MDKVAMLLKELHFLNGDRVYQKMLLSDLLIKLYEAKANGMNIPTNNNQAGETIVFYRKVREKAFLLLQLPTM